MASGLAGATQFGQRGRWTCRAPRRPFPARPGRAPTGCARTWPRRSCRAGSAPASGSTSRAGRPLRRVADARARGAAATGGDRPGRGPAAQGRGGDDPSPKVLAESFEVMAELEAACAALAARRMPAGLRRSLARVHGRLRLLADAGDPEDYAALNLEFHDLIWQGCGNATLAAMTADVRRRVGPFRRLQFRLAGRLQRSWEEHDAVVQAILAGDPRPPARRCWAMSAWWAMRRPIWCGRGASGRHGVIVHARLHTI